MNRRKFVLSASSVLGTIGVAGCASFEGEEDPITVNNVCSGECSLVENVTVDSHSGLDPYTDITVSFSKAISSVQLTVETLNESGESNGIKDISKTDEITTGVTVNFDNFKTHDLEDVRVVIHSISVANEATATVTSAETEA